MYVVSETLLQVMKAHAPHRLDQLMPQLGLSYNSWRKLQRGEPLRASLAHRLVERVSELTGERFPPEKFLSAPQQIDSPNSDGGTEVGSYRHIVEA